MRYFNLSRSVSPNSVTSQQLEMILKIQPHEEITSLSKKLQQVFISFILSTNKKYFAILTSHSQVKVHDFKILQKSFVHSKALTTFHGRSSNRQRNFSTDYRFVILILQTRIQLQRAAWKVV